MTPPEAKQLARLIIEAGRRCDITFRAFGGTGVTLLYLSGGTGQYFRQHIDDVDLLGKFEEQALWQPVFEKLGFSLREASKNPLQCQYEFVGKIGDATRLVHVYTDPLRFTEVIPGPYFTSEWPVTVPLAALLLSKLLVQRDYDRTNQQLDLAALLHIHVSEPASLDLAYLRGALRCGFAGWRRWLCASHVFDRLDHRLLAQDPDFAFFDRAGLVKFRSAIETAEPDWRWRMASWCHSHCLPGPFYVIDLVEPL